jgi:protease IV
MRQFLKWVLASMVGTILAIFAFVLIAIVIIGGIASTFKEDKPLTVKEGSVLVIDLENGITDRANENPFENFDFNSFSTKSKIGLNHLLEDLKKAAKDKDVKGIYLELSTLPAGMASIEEIRNAILEFNKSGKFSIAYSETFTQKSYYLASACKKIYLHPTGDMEWKGLGVEMMFFKGMLAKLEVEPEIIRHGKFKSAVEPFILDKMSPENREQTRTYVTAIWNQMLKGVSAQRKIDVVQLNQIADGYKVRKAQNALDFKFVDKLVYKDEVLEEIRTLTGAKSTDKIAWVKLTKYHKAPSNEKKSLSDPKIAVIYAIGEIESGEGSSEKIGSETLANAIRKAREDEKIKAIVLRVNSPGGSALASEVIWREMNLAKKVKPVIVSMGDVAASGGYYIAAPANKIFAEPNTITGSIGVFGLLLNAQKMLNNKLGITFDTLGTNRLANFGSFTRPLTAEERGILQESVEDVYSVFVQRVSEGRKLNIDAVDSIGQGRVWSGTDAKKIGLIDEFGGLNEAIAAAALMAKTPKYRVVELPEEKDPFEEMIKELSGNVETKYLQWKLGEHHQILKSVERIQHYNGIYTLMPNTPDFY